MAACVDDASTASVNPRERDHDPASYEERFIGEWMAHEPQYKGLPAAQLMEKQGQLQELYEGRIASMERLVGFLVLFHAMAKRVQDFWPAVSLGVLHYDMSRTHSIMRIATTASPVSGSDVRHKMVELAEETKKAWCVNMLKQRWFKKRGRTSNFDELTDDALDQQV